MKKILLLMILALSVFMCSVEKEEKKQEKVLMEFLRKL